MTSAARALPAGGGTAGCVGAFVGVAAADDEEDTGGDVGAAVEGATETVAVGDGWDGEEAGSAVAGVVLTALSGAPNARDLG
ncbi:MAG: hypothetical protein ACXVHI_01325 [Frankiaceae bacterium]